MTRTILVVEDDVMLRQAVTDTLEAHGFQVVSARDGAEALELVAGGQYFDALVTDLKMPRMGGDSLISILRQRGCGQPMFVQTGRVGAIEIEGATAVLHKPYSIRQLASLIDAALPAV